MIKTPGRSAFAGLREVPPGTTVVVSSEGESRQRYWSLPPAEHRDDLPTTVERARGLLGQAVRGQLAADVPVCMLLSGGLDSSALAALGRPAAGNLHTLSVDVGARAASGDAMGRGPDGPYIDLMVRHLVTAHRTVRPNAGDLADPALRAWAGRLRDGLTMGDFDTSLLLLFRAAEQQQAPGRTSGRAPRRHRGGRPRPQFPSAVVSAVVAGGATDVLVVPRMEGRKRRFGKVQQTRERFLASTLRITGYR